MNFSPIAIRALALAAALVAFGGTVEAASVNFGTTANLAPYNFLDNEGTVAGFEADLAKLICTRADLDCAWVPTPWGQLIPDLRAGDIDVIMSDFQITPARKLLISFSKPYFPVGPDAVMVLAGGFPPSAGSPVGALQGTFQAGYVQKKGWALTQYSGPADGLEALQAGEISAYIGDQAHLQSVINANPGVYHLAIRGIAVDDSKDGGIGLGVRPGDMGLLSTLNSAIAGLKADGTLDALIGKWFDGRKTNYRGAEKAANSE